MARVSWGVVAAVTALAALASAVGVAGAMAARAAHIHADTPMCPFANVQTGDVVLFRWDGTDAVHDLVSTFSHVGLVILRGGEPWILETHRHGDGPVGSGGGGGVRAYPLRTRVQTYPGAAWILKLNRSRWQVRPEDLDAALPELYEKPYDYDHKSRLASCFADAVLGLPGRHHKDRQEMFCSEFVGELLRRVGVLPQEYDTSCLTPESFAHMPDVYPHMLKLS